MKVYLATMGCQMNRLDSRLVMASLCSIGVLALLIAVQGCHRMPDQSTFLSMGAAPDEAVVQLRCAKIPHIEHIAAHCWFAEYDPNGRTWHRWEVWQKRGSGRGDWGHLRKNLMSASSGVGAGPAWVLAEWRGSESARVSTVLNDPENYPYTDTYRYWPGPNSNTYVGWVLRKADVKTELPSAAIGASYR